MAACGSLQHIFEKPLPEKPTLLESLSSWKKKINPIVEQSPSFTEIFGELHFNDINTNTTQPTFRCSSSSSSSSSSFGSCYDDGDALGDKKVVADGEEEEEEEEDKDSLFLKKKKVGGRSLSYTPMNYESLHMCTEGLGFESSDDVDIDMKGGSMHALVANQGGEGLEEGEEKHVAVKRRSASWDAYNGYRGGWLLRGVGEVRRTLGGTDGGGERRFPPPISCIGKSGKPGVSFKSYREEGRFVLKEVRIPTQEFLHASREDGRLKLKFIQPEDDEEYLEEEDEDEDHGEDQEEEEEEEENCLEEDENLKGG